VTSGVAEIGVHKMTGMPATRLGLSERGAVVEGAIADLVIFDARTVADRATFEQPHQYAAGIGDVLVNGIPVVSGGALTAARPGRVVRHVPTR
jgi:N-acyl-D-aspartate/D-glutamate deacylase